MFSAPNRLRKSPKNNLNLLLDKLFFFRYYGIRRLLERWMIVSLIDKMRVIPGRPLESSLLLNMKLKFSILKIQRKGKLKLLNALPLNSLKKGFNGGLAVKEISLSQAIKILQQKKFLSYLRHEPLVSFISHNLKKNIKQSFELKFKIDDILLIIVLKNRTKKTGDVKIKKNLRFFLVSQVLIDLEDELNRLDKVLES